MSTVQELNTAADEMRTRARAVRDQVIQGIQSGDIAVKRIVGITIEQAGFIAALLDAIAYDMGQDHSQEGWAAARQLAEAINAR